MSDQYFLDRGQQAELRKQLATIPTLIQDLAITITRQHRIQKNALGKLHPTKPGSRLPYHLGAAQANDDLHLALTTWTKALCRERHIHYRGPETTLHLSLWLQHHTHELALTTNAKDAHAHIISRIQECRRQIDLPPDDDILIDAERLREANRKVLTAEQIERIATQLGPMGHKLDARRVQTLVRQRKLQPCAEDGGTRFYRLGDVLHAHHHKDEPKNAGWIRLRDNIKTN